MEGVEGFEGAGMGRLITFSEPQPLTHLVERIAHGVGSPKGFPLAIPVSSISSLPMETCNVDEKCSKGSKSKTFRSAPSASVLAVDTAS